MCGTGDRKSTRLNSSHEWSSYAVFCLKKKKKRQTPRCRSWEMPRALEPALTLEGQAGRDPHLPPGQSRLARPRQHTSVALEGVPWARRGWAVRRVGGADGDGSSARTGDAG